MITEMAVSGAFIFSPEQFGDDRGLFLEWYKAGAFVDIVGHSLDVKQANLSVSAAGVLRGIHFADVPPGQAKYVTCPKGAILDVVVDLRVGSPTFSRWDSVILDDVDRRCIYLAEGLGHAFLSLEDGSTVVYLCSAGYSPSREHGIHPLDPDVGIEWPTTGRSGEPLEYEFSEKDSEAPSLQKLIDSGLLPSFEETVNCINSLNS